MKQKTLFVFLILVWLFGCQTTERQPPSVSERDSVAAVKDSRRFEKRHVDLRLASESAIVSAVKYALSLEKRLLDHGSEFRSKEQVYQHYRKGFGREMAKKLADYSWASDEIGLRATERTMEVPQIVEVARIHREEAIAFFSTALWMREMRGSKRFTVVTLKKEKGRWVVMDAKRVSSPPSP